MSIIKTTILFFDIIDIINNNINFYNFKFILPFVDNSYNTFINIIIFPNFNTYIYIINNLYN